MHQTAKAHGNILLATVAFWAVFLSGCGATKDAIVSDNERACWSILGLTGRFLVGDTYAEFEMQLIHEVKTGTDADLRAALVFCTMGDAEQSERAEDTIVSLLEAVGDDKFCRVLRELPAENRSCVASVLAAILWKVDDEDSFRRAKAHPDGRFPKTWRCVFDLLA